MLDPLRLPALVALLAGATVARAAGDDALSEGDAAWFGADRQAARAAWQVAAGAGDPATRAMAETRLLLVSGNLGLAIHGPRADAALRACPVGDARCDLAEADYQLILDLLGFGGDTERATVLAERAAAELPAQAAARLVWAGAAPLSLLEEQAPSERDALGDGLLENRGRWPTGPGTWFAGLGVAGAPGLGLGGGLRLVHPDVLWRGWQLDLEAAATTRGAYAGRASLNTPGTWWSAWRLAGWHSVADRYDDAGRRLDPWVVWGAQAAAGPGSRLGRWSGWVGPMARLDTPQGGSRLSGSGAQVGVAWDDRAAAEDWGWRTGQWLRAGVTTTIAELGADYHHLAMSATGGDSLVLGGGLLAARVGVEAAGKSNAPDWRLPTAGGGEWLRGVPTARYRGPIVVGLSAEYRHPIVGMLGGVVFAEVAAIEAPHADVGAGLRLGLPPRPLNTVRLDVAIGDDGWAMTGGIGEVF